MNRVLLLAEQKLLPAVLCVVLVSCGGAKNNDGATAGSSIAISSTSVSDGIISSGASSSQDRFNLSDTQVEKSVVCPSEPVFRFNINFPEPRLTQEVIEAALAADGLQGKAHGIVKQDNKYVLELGTGNANERFSVYSEDSQIMDQLASLSRGDQVAIQGDLVPTSSAQRHIKITQLSVSAQVAKPIHYQHQNYDNIFANKEQVKLLGTVHIIVDGGRALVLNYEDMVLPIIVDEELLPVTSKLFRGDKVLVDTSIQRFPGRPLHFYTRIGNPEAIKVIDPIENCNGHELTLEGNLIRVVDQFYGVRVVDENGVFSVFLLLPNGANSLAVEQKLEAKWLGVIDEAVDGRNHIINPTIQVRIKGTAQILSPFVAHAQFVVEDPDSIEFITDDL